MIRHIIFFKLIDNSLENKINVIKFYQVGMNFSLEDRAYDIALVSDFMRPLHRK